MPVDNHNYTDPAQTARYLNHDPASLDARGDRYIDEFFIFCYSYQLLATLAHKK